MDRGRLCQLQRNHCKEVVIHEITGFLRGFPPFDAATEEVLEAVEGATEIEFFPVGAFVLRAGAGSSQHAYVVRTGHAELIDGGRVIDVVGPGDVVGLPSMLTNLAPGLDVRAAEDLLVYRVAADAMLPLLSGRSGLRFVAETVRNRTRPGVPTAGSLSPLRRSCPTSPGGLSSSRRPWPCGMWSA